MQKKPERPTLSGVVSCQFKSSLASLPRVSLRSGLVELRLMMDSLGLSEMEPSLTVILVNSCICENVS